MRSLTIAIALLLSCSPLPVTLPSPSATTSSTATPTATASASLTPTRALVGTLSASRPFIRPDDPKGFGIPIMSDGRFAAAALNDGHGTYRLVAVDLSSGSIRTVPVPDGAYGGIVGLDSGRLAISAWRPGPGDLRTYDYQLEDLATSTRRTLDHFEVPGRFHSQGAAPAPDPLFIFSHSAVAYNHLYTQGDQLYAELRLGPIDGPMRVAVTTTAVVAPVALSDTALVYWIAVGAEYVVHLYDLASARDRVLLRAPAGTVEVALSNDRLLYSTHMNSPTAQTGRLVIRDLATDSETTLTTGNCTYPTLNERYAVAGCADAGRAPMTVTAYDLATLQSVEVARSLEPLAGPRAAPGVIYWIRYAGAPPITPYFELLRY